MRYVVFTALFLTRNVVEEHFSKRRQEIFEKATKHTELSSGDYAQIAKAVA